MGAILSAICKPLLHWIRLFGYAPVLLYLLYRTPLKTGAALAFYYLILSKLPIWIRIVRWFAATGFDQRFHLLKQGEIDFQNKRYLVCIHPHGIYVEGALYTIAFQKELFEQQFPGVKYVGAGADQISKLPLFREIMTNDTRNGKAGDALIGVSKREILGAFKKDPKVSIGICPGGFSEAVFTDARNKVEYSYLKGRKGFIKLAIEAGVDILPIYQFNVNKLYHTPRGLRGLRARIAQQLAIPMVIWWGWMGTNQPLDNTQVYTVIGQPFPASQYSLEEIDKAHADYMSTVKDLYDTYKHQFGSGDKELVFIGKDFHDRDIIPTIFRRLGVHTSHVIPGTTLHREEIRRIETAKREAKRRLRELMLEEGDQMAGDTD